MGIIADFIDRTEPVAADATCEFVYMRFQDEAETMVIAVVDEDGRPLGLVERNVFLLRMASQFGRAFYGRRLITRLMDAEPMIFEASQSTSQLFSDLDEAQLNVLMRGFLVVENGAYFGVGTAAHLLRVGYQINRARADRMTQLAEDLAWAEAQAQASSRAKSQFLAVMSHEIRTPLNGVIGVAELVLRKLDSPGFSADDIRPYVRTIIESGQDLHVLLSDVLDFSRAEAGAMTLDEKPLSLRHLARDLDALWRPCAEQKGIDFDLSLSTEGDPWGVGDSTRLKQVFNNLIGNALKFTNEGSVSVSLSCLRQDEKLHIRGEVVDSGPGVPEDLAPRLFDPFTTGGHASSGTGLGLSICRQLLERMGGAIRLETPPGGGARFVVELVLSAASPAEAPVEPPTPHQSLHVLVADDNPTNRFVACKLLETFGCTTETAENGAQAVEAVAARPFDLVLMDIKMPVMDGIEATRAIRSSSHSASGLPIIALTANADPADQVGYLAAGMAEVVPKPVRPEVLLNAIRRALNSAPQASMAAA